MLIRFGGGRGWASPKIYIYHNSLIFSLICMKFGRGVNSEDVDTHVYFEDSTTYFGHMAKNVFLESSK